MVTVSVVIPMFNMEEWLEESLSTVVRQSCDHDALEIVVVDDGSTDRSANMAKSVLRRGRIAYRILTTENQGPSAARNLGWRNSRGRWIQFLDADDLLDVEKIETQVVAAETASAQVAVLYSPWQPLTVEAGRWRPGGTLASPTIGDDPLADLLRPDNFIATGSQLFRRTWLETVSGFDERLTLIEDVDLLLRIAISGGGFQQVPSDKAMFFYRRRAVGSFSSGEKRPFVEGCLRNVRMVEAHWHGQGPLTLPRARVLADAYLFGARYLAGVDREAFKALADHMESLVPRFVPTEPKRLRYLATVVGYRRAEQWAAQFRAMKTQRNPDSPAPPGSLS